MQQETQALAPVLTIVAACLKHGVTPHEIRHTSGAWLACVLWEDFIRLPVTPETVQVLDTPDTEKRWRPVRFEVDGVAFSSVAFTYDWDRWVNPPAPDEDDGEVEF